MEITEAERPSRIDLDLEFMAPAKARNRTEFLLATTDGGTSVSWIMTGSSLIMFRLMGLFMNMDRMIGKDFENGLANLKKAAEAGDDETHDLPGLAHDGGGNGAGAGRAVLQHAST